MTEPNPNPTTPPPGSTVPPTTATRQTAAPDTLMCVLSYLGLFAIIPLVVKKDDPFIQWHARQGIALFAAIIVVMVLLTIVGVTLVYYIHWTLGVLVNLVLLAAAIGAMVLAIIGIIKACSGERWVMPLIGPSVNKAA